MLNNSKITSSKEASLESKYQKFWSVPNSPLENARAVLANYCSRELLQWAPSMFQRIGKNRTADNVKFVNKILDDSKITSIEMLVKKINASISDYSLDSSLLRRLEFICIKANIRHTITLDENRLALILNDAAPKILANDSVHTISSPNSNSSVDTISSPSSNSKEEFLPTPLTPAQKLLESYQKYPLLEGFNNERTIMMEDKDYENVPLIKNPMELKDRLLYLYVITATGETYFAPQMVEGRKLTHGGLARKAKTNYEIGNTPPVLAAGAVVKANNKFYLTLASGHFEPPQKAYFPAAEILIEKINSAELHVQAAYSTSHYKNLSLDRCVQINPEAMLSERNFRLQLLTFVDQSMDKELVDTVKKLFTAINTAGTDFDEENDVEFSVSELEMLFKDNELSQLLQTNIELCPQNVKLYSENIENENKVEPLF